MNSLIAALAGALEKRRLPFMLIGGQAVLLHGQPRLTEGIDITLGIGQDEWERVMEVCRELALRPLPEDVATFVRGACVLPARHEESAIRVHFIFSTTEYERQAIGRAVRVELGDASIPFATAEDLVLHKLFAGRPGDREDAVSVVRRNSERLDWSYIERWGQEFARVPGRENLPDEIVGLREGGAP